MEAIQKQLMFCVAAYRQGVPTAERVPGMSDSDWKELYRLSGIHKLTPVVYETLWRSSNFCNKDTSLQWIWRQESVIQAIIQAQRTQKIVQISVLLQTHKVPHAVVKGVLCRVLYSRPDIRISGDEDLLISAESKAQCQLLLEQCGLELLPDISSDDVAHWHDKQTGLHIELHTQLFSSQREEDKLLNELFKEQLNHTVLVDVPGGKIQTFHPTYHFFFLVCHALKHFLTGGFGVRTICDVVTFAERYHDQIHRQTVSALLERVGGRLFLDQLFAVGEEWWGFDISASGWSYSKKPDASELLQDCLDAGIYGQSSMSRKHSAGIVLQAAEKQSQKANTLSAVFPSKERMVGKYPILKSKPILLPACWAHRLGKYAVEVMRSGKEENSPLESVSLGKKRVEMMVKYGVLPKSQKKN